MRLNSEDKYWLDKCKENPNKYSIMINENSIYVVSTPIDKMLHEFSNGIYFISQLLEYFGFPYDIV